MEQIPNITFPYSTSLVTVQAIDTTLQLYVKSTNFLNPVIPGHEAYNCPALAFLITHQATGERVLFDAGARKDFWNYSPAVTTRFKTGFNVLGMRVSKGIHEILAEAGIDPSSISNIIWSHWHFDHIGDTSKFPASVGIVTGSGFKSKLLPGYPANPESPLLESDYAGHDLHEIEWTDDFQIGDFRAFDFFQDGSFYLLDVPGHAVGHMCGFARTTPDTFVLLGADTCHFAGSIRPTAGVPLPEFLDKKASGLDESFPDSCPCSLFTDCHPGTEPGRHTMPWYNVSQAPGSAYANPDTANKSILSLQDFDACGQVLVCLAHDPSLFEVLPLLNIDKTSSINDWQARGYRESVRWRFLNELPRSGRPGRPPLVLGYWRDGRQVDVETAFRTD